MPTNKLSTVLTFALLSCPAWGQPGFAQEGPVPAEIYNLTLEETELETAASSPARERLQETVIERYSNGRPKVERQVALDDSENFVNHGYFRAFTTDGNLLGTGTFEMGLQHGTWTRRFNARESDLIDAQVITGFTSPYTSKAQFINGQLDGDWIVLDRDGKAIFQWHFVNGEREGDWIWFTPDGQVRKQAHYEEGVIVGDIVAYAGTKQVQVLARYLDGRQLSARIAKYPKGQQQSAGHVLMPRQVTDVDVDWWSGAMTERVVRSEGEEDRHGQWKFWHANGNLQLEGAYDTGKEVGAFIWYHPNGQKESEAFFANGKLEGEWKSWYANGLRKGVGQYVDGRREGIWVSWHENGMRKFEGSYNSGELLTGVRLWDSQGKLLDEDSHRADAVQQAQSPEPIELELR